MATTIIKSFNSDNQAIVDDTGHLLTTGTATLAGPVTTEVAGLNSFKTSQYALGTTEQQITPTALPNRSSISLKVVCTGGNAIYFSATSGTALTQGYPLFNGDSVQMDLTPDGTIYAVATAAGQLMYVLEIA